MKKLVMILALVQVGFVANSQARSLYFLCDTIAGVKLPGACKATCEKSNGSAKLTLADGKGRSTSVEIGMNDRTDSEAVNGDVLTIAAGEKGTYPSVHLAVNRAEQVQSISVNDLECK